MGDSCTVSPCSDVASIQCINDQSETGKNLSRLCEGKGQWYHCRQTQSRLSQHDCCSTVPIKRQSRCRKFEATWVCWQKQQLFWRWGTSILSSCPNPLLHPSFIALQTPEFLPNRLSCQAFGFKRQMQKLCVDVSVWEWACVTRGDTKNPHCTL